MEATNGGGTGDAGCHNIEIVEADEALLGHVDGKMVRGEQVSVEDGFCDICHMKHLSKGVSFAKQEGYVAFALCFH